MAYGYGRSDGVSGVSGGKDVQRIPKSRGNKNLALLHKNVNNAKGIYFRGNNLDSEWALQPDQDHYRPEVRRGVGPFNFLAATDAGTGDTIWKKWARVSNWIDMVCNEFDKQYQWGSRTDEPRNSAGTASLRSLWAFWIDQELADIEAKAATWALAAQTTFDTRFQQLSQDEKKWRRDAFGRGGYALPAHLKFPAQRTCLLVPRCMERMAGTMSLSTPATRIQISVFQFQLLNIVRHFD